MLAKVLGRLSRTPPQAEPPELHLRVQLRPDELDGGWVAECVNLPGCFSQGETEQEAVANVIDAISGVLAVRLQGSADHALADRPSAPAAMRERELDLALNG